MQITRATPPAPPRPPAGSAESPKIQGRALADLVVRRASLAGAALPVAMGVGLAEHASENLAAVGIIGKSMLGGNLPAAGAAMSNLVSRATHPDGVARGLFTGALYLQGAADGLSGGLELTQGKKNHDRFLGSLGAADLLICASSGALALGHPVASLAMDVAGCVSKAALVLASPSEYTRLQKMHTLFDAATEAAGCMLVTGIGVMPALVVEGVVGPVQMLYMTFDGFREKTDHAIDWALKSSPSLPTDPGRRG